jgi:hypothetical protein
MSRLVFPRRLPPVFSRRPSYGEQVLASNLPASRREITHRYRTSTSINHQSLPSKSHDGPQLSKYQLDFQTNTQFQHIHLSDTSKCTSPISSPSPLPSASPPPTPSNLHLAAASPVVPQTRARRSGRRASSSPRAASSIALAFAFEAKGGPMSPLCDEHSDVDWPESSYQMI